MKRFIEIDDFEVFVEEPEPPLTTEREVFVPTEEELREFGIRKNKKQT